MRIAIVSAARRQGIPEYVNSLGKGMEAMGHRIDILDAWTENGMRLPGYEYIVVCAEKISFWSGKIPDVLQRVLSAGSGLVGRKSAAFVKKSGPIFVTKALWNVMKAMEKEGMKVNWSEIILNPSHAEALGKRIGS